jgi:hypothetical protein
MFRQLAIRVDLAEEPKSGSALAVADILHSLRVLCVESIGAAVAALTIAFPSSRIQTCLSRRPAARAR